MNYDMFFVSPRWTILEVIARKPSSPVEISQHIGTSVSYVSQQLKLLEVAGLVVKDRTGKADKGKPRLVYSIAKEVLQLTGMLKGMSVKKQIILDEHHKTILRIWALGDEKLHYLIEKLYWKLEDNLDEVKGVYFDASRKEVLVVSDSRRVRGVVDGFDGLKARVVFSSELKKHKELHAVYDPDLLVKDLKGGSKGR